MNAKSFALTNKLVREIRGPWFEMATVSVTNLVPEYNGSAFFLHNSLGTKARRMPSRFPHPITDPAWNPEALEGDLVVGCVADTHGPAEPSSVITGSLFEQWKSFRIGRLPTIRRGLSSSVGAVAGAPDSSSKKRMSPVADPSASFSTVSDDEHMLIAMTAEQAMLDWTGLRKFQRYSKKDASSVPADDDAFTNAKARGMIGVRAVWFAAILTRAPRSALRDYRDHINRRTKEMEADANLHGHYDAGKGGLAYTNFGHLAPPNPLSPHAAEKKLEEAKKEGAVKAKSEYELFLEDRRRGHSSIFEDHLEKRQTGEPEMEELEWTASLTVANVGNCRAFAVHCGNSDDRRPVGNIRDVLQKDERLTPMSMDHNPERDVEVERIRAAGGTVKHGRVDGLPHLDCSREFGRFDRKDNFSISPASQKIVATPDVLEMTMRVGDYLVLASNGVFDSRGASQTTLREIYHYIKYLHLNGGSVADIACGITDLAIQCGAERALTVNVMKFRAPVAEEVVRTQHLRPGPLYVTMIRNNPAYREAFLRDIQRCQTTVASVLRQRYAALDASRAAIETVRRHVLPLNPQHAGWLLQLYNDEMDLLTRTPPPSPPSSDSSPACHARWEADVLEHYERLAALLLKPPPKGGMSIDQGSALF